MDVKIGSQFRDSEVAVSGKQQAAPSSSPLASTIRKHVEHQAPSSKWYHATSHVVAAMVGAGVLGLPRALALLTWPGGIIALAVAFAVTLYTSHQLVNMFSLNEERHPTYRAVASVAFGRWAPLVVLPFQIFVTVGTGIAYVILFGTLARSMFVLVTPHSGDGPKLLVWFSIYIGCQCVLSLLPSLEKVRVLSFVALLASIGYCVIAIILCGALGVQPDVQYSVPDSSGTGITSGILLALGITAFAFGGHAIMVEVESTLATDRDPRHEMMKGVYTAYIIVAVLYFGVAIAGYLVFGANVKDDILLSIASASSSATISNAVVAAELLVMLHITFAFQVYMMPVFALVEERFPPPKATPSHPDHLAIVRLIGHRILRRWPILAAQWLVASAFPFFGGIIGFVGGLGTTVLTFVLPPIMYLIWVKRGFKSKIFAAVAASWIIVVVYSIVGVSASAGSIWTLATNTTFAFFQ